MSSVVGAVIRREYLQRVRSRWFVFATVAGPLFLLGLIVVPALLQSRGQQVDRTLAVVDQTGVLYGRLAPRLEDGGYTVEQASAGDEVSLEQSIRDGDLGGYLVLSDQTLARGRAELHAESSPSAIRMLTLRQAVVQSALEARLQADTDEVRSLLAGGDLVLTVLSDNGAQDEAGFARAYIGAFLLYMVILLYAVSIMRSVLEEKTSRVVEVVLSSMRPFDLMLGKILGVGAVGLTQLGIWVASGIVIASAGVPMLLAARPELGEMSDFAAVLPGMSYMVYFLIYFLGGYFIFSGTYAAVGAMCNSEEETQQAQLPVMMLLIIPIVFVTQIIKEPNSGMSVTLSLIPFFSPVLMFARASIGAAPLWQVGLSVVLMALTVVAVAWVAGRIYKVGILMSGKRPTLPELVRWVREA